MRFSAYPIVIPDISNSQNPAAVKLASKALNAVSRLRVPIAFFLIMVIGPIAASMLDQISSLFFMLVLIEGQLVVRPDAVLRHALYYGLMPFDVPKLFEKWNDNANCKVSDAFDRNDLSCSIFGNYGEDLIVLMVTLAINIVISLTLQLYLKRDQLEISNDLQKKPIQGIKSFSNNFESPKSVHHNQQPALSSRFKSYRKHQIYRPVGIRDTSEPPRIKVGSQPSQPHIVTARQTSRDALKM